MGENQRNLLLAGLLAIAVMIGWDYFYMRPRFEAEQKARAVESAFKPTERPQAQNGPSSPFPAPSAAGAPSLPAAAKKPDAARTKAPRVLIETPNLKGSLSLLGARLDDLKLLKHTDKIGPGAKPVALLQPGVFYADLGWTARPELGLKLPSADTLWTASAQRLAPGQPVTLAWDNGAGLRFVRRISVDNDFMFTVEDAVENGTGKPVSLANYGLVRHRGAQLDGGLASVVFEGAHGVFNGTLKEEKYADLDKEPQATETSTGGWLGITEKYWMATLIPAQNKSFTGRFLRLPDAGEPSYQADYLMPEQTVAPNGRASVTNHLFAGAKINSVISRYQTALAVDRFDLSIDWGWFFFITKPMFWTLDNLNKAVGNFGVAILLLTLLVKALFFPIANKQYESMTRMKKVQPKIKAVQERYKDDKARLQQEMMALYKREKINPVTGCLPILLQFPVFFALYKTLYVTIEMRHQPFFGWIHDLSAPDPMTFITAFGALPWNAPSFLMIGIWPIIMGVTMWMQQTMNPPASDPVQQKVMNFLPVIFTIMLAQMPAGLVIYWTANTILSALQQWFIMRRMGVHVSDD